MKKTKEIITGAIFLGFLCNSCSQSIYSVSSSATSPKLEPTFYSDHHYQKTDAEMNKTDVFLLIVSSSCTHCLEAEPIIQRVVDKYFSDQSFVVVYPSDLSTYQLPFSYRESVKIYYEQGPDYVSPEFLPDHLYKYDSYPTPTAMYLDKKREIRHLIFGLKSTETGIKSDFNRIAFSEPGE